MQSRGVRRTARPEGLLTRAQGAVRREHQGGGIRSARVDRCKNRVTRVTAISPSAVRTQERFTGSMSTTRLTSSGSERETSSPSTNRLSRLICRVRTMIWCR